MDELATQAAAAGIYLLAAHPHWRDSRVNRRLLAAARATPGVDAHDLYASYADYDIDVAGEQARAARARLRAAGRASDHRRLRPLRPDHLPYARR